MRVVLDTNILISALLLPAGHPAAIYRYWQEAYFTLLTCSEQLSKLRTTLHKPAIATRIRPHHAGRLVNQWRELAENINSLPHVRRSSDPTDDFLLALTQAGEADYLVTGDKSGLLSLAQHKGPKKTTRILAANEFAQLFN